MAASDGAVVGTTKILDNGSDSERWNLVLMADGYTKDQLSDFARDCQNFVAKLVTTPPFDSLQSALNVHRVDVWSLDTGADDPAACGGTGAVARTLFDSSFCTCGIRRLLAVNNATALQVAISQVPAFAMAMVLVNSSTYGGSGGSVAVFSRAPDADEIALHEMGHTAFGFADEYEYWAGCGAETDHNQHQALEPGQPNVTTDANPATIKWRNLLTASQLPTTRNADCAQCDPQPNPFSPTTVGAYEGAHYYHCGCYRPQFNCRMRQLGQPYCAVCQERIRQTLAPHLPSQPQQPQRPQGGSKRGCLSILPIALLLIPKPALEFQLKVRSDQHQ
jgi:hypothetical protein